MGYGLSRGSSNGGRMAETEKMILVLANSVRVVRAVASRGERCLPIDSAAG